MTTEIESATIISVKTLKQLWWMLNERSSRAVDIGLHFVLKQISDQARLHIFKSVGRMLGVKSYTCIGELGEFEGSLYDRYVQAVYLLAGSYEGLLQKVLGDYIFKVNQGTYVDVGANIGLTVIPLAKTRDISCFAFEPEPENYAHLRKNILANGVESRIVPFNVALFSTEGSVEFELSSTNSGDHRIRCQSPLLAADNASGELLRTVITVSAQTLDSVLARTALKAPVVLKIDTQGSEVQILRGARSFLEVVDYLFIEFWPYALSRVGDSTESFNDEIKQFPYGALYDRGWDSTMNPPKLEPIASIIRKITAIAKQKGNFVDTDVILSRHPSISYSPGEIPNNQESIRDGQILY